MRIAIIANIDKEEMGEYGVSNKVVGMVRALREEGVETDVFWLSGKNLLRNEEMIGAYQSGRRNFVFWGFMKRVLQSMENDRYDAVWIRHGYFHPGYFRAIMAYKLKNKRCKFLYELPTYPVINEFSGIAKIMAGIYMKLLSERSRAVFDHIITYSMDEEIFQVPTIRISNGVDCAEYKILPEKKAEKGLRFVAIGGLWPWYGLDRLIRGMEMEVSKNADVDLSLSIIGRGKEETDLKGLVKSCGLENRVHFLGWKTKEEIDALLKGGEIGVGTLAIFRKKVARSSSLKHREYAARGMRFIYAGKDEEFAEAEDFALPLEESNAAINTALVLAHFQKSAVTPKDIRAYAERELSWGKSLKKVLAVIAP